MLLQGLLWERAMRLEAAQGRRSKCGVVWLNVPGCLGAMMMMMMLMMMLFREQRLRNRMAVQQLQDLEQEATVMLPV